MTLSLTTAWNEAAAFMRRDFGRLFLIAFGLVSLPALILQAAMPETQPGVPPEIGAWALLFGPALLLSLLGTLTLTGLALGRTDEPSGAFRHALSRLPAVLGAAILFGLGAGLGLVPLVVIVALAAPSDQAATAAMLPIAFVYFLILWVRMILINPIGAAEAAGPLTIVKRSWSLTRGYALRLTGFILGLLLLFAVMTIAVQAVGGSIVLLLAGGAERGSLGSVLILLVGGLLNALVALFFSALVARIYVQLVGPPTSGT